MTPSEYATGMYARVNRLWETRGHEFFGGACGFSIISGPPIHEPSFLIIGANPGFGASDDRPHVEPSWPAESYLVGGRVLRPATGHLGPKGVVRERPPVGEPTKWLKKLRMDPHVSGQLREEREVERMNQAGAARGSRLDKNRD